jgi:hypothetical protein
MSTLIGPPLIERFLCDGSLVQSADAQPIVRYAFHLLLPKKTLPSIAVHAFAVWIEASSLALEEEARRVQT